MDSIDCIVPEKLERLAHRIQQALEQTHSANLSTPHQNFQKISRRGMAFTEHSDILPACNGMLCITLFLYIADYKIIIKHDRSFRPIFSGQEEHPSFSTNCITASCKTTVRFYLPLLPGRGQRAPANAIY